MHQSVHGFSMTTCQSDRIGFSLISAYSGGREGETLELWSTGLRTISLPSILYHVLSAHLAGFTRQACGQTGEGRRNEAWHDGA